ncbi:MAG: SLC13 family permease [Deltaproteobacteria bacterium]|nr:MAG: SLC13 family permease [Deltaproteobacteria bacterium]
MSGLPPEAWFTLVVLVAMFITLIREVLPPDAILFTALVVLWGAGVIGIDEAVAGFSNAGVLTVALLFIVAAAMQETGALQGLNRVMLGRHLDRKRVLARLLFPTAGLSAFLNNTPIVAMFAPAVRDWALKNNRPPSKFLIPLSYAAILGGTCTLIGTSTNLVVSGLLTASGHEPFGMFELTAVGLPATLVGVLFLLLVGRHLLPDRRTPDQTARAASREYGVTLEVAPDCPLIGQSIEQAGLRSLQGLFLVAIERQRRRIAPVRPSNRLRAGDRLVLFGVADTVVELQKTRGLLPVSADDLPEPPPDTRDRRIYEVVLSDTSPLVGKTLRSANFRRRYDAAVIAIHRGGQRLDQKLGEVVLRTGDTLMLEASPGFRSAWADSTDFYLVAQLPDAQRPRHGFARLAFLTLVAMVVAMGTGVVHTLLAVAIAVVILIQFRCIGLPAARRAVDLSVLVVIASSFGIAAAVLRSGLADAFAGGLLGLFGEFPPWVILAALYLLTVAMTETLSNNAAAALAFPLAMATAEQLAVDPRPWAVVVAIAASMSFITPLGYQTNLIVYGPGGYRFTDYLRVGIPMALIVFVVTMVVVPIVWGLHPA